MGFHTTGAMTLHAPFRYIHEFLFLIPKGGSLEFDDPEPKIILVSGGAAQWRLRPSRVFKPLAENDILLLPAGTRYEYHNPDAVKEVSLQVVRLMPRAPSPAGKSRSRMGAGQLLHRCLARPVHLHGGMGHELQRLLSLFRREMTTGETGHDVRVQAIALEMLVFISRRLFPTAVGEAKPGAAPVPRMVLAAQEFIRKNLGRDFTLAEVALATGKGPEHLCRVFHRATGQTVFDHANAMRIDRAKNLLMDPTRTLGEIARLTGFKSLSYFSRTFRKQAGMTASEFRKR